MATLTPTEAKLAQAVISLAGAMLQTHEALTQLAAKTGSDDEFRATLKAMTARLDAAINALTEVGNG